MILYLKYIIETVLFPRLIWPFFFLSFFLSTIHQELYHYLQDSFFISVDISKVYVMSSPTSQSSPAFHSFFSKEKTSAETATKLDLISSIWGDSDFSPHQGGKRDWNKRKISWRSSHYTLPYSSHCMESRRNKTSNHNSPTIQVCGNIPRIETSIPSL